MSLLLMDSARQPPVVGSQWAFLHGSANFDQNYQSLQCYDMLNDLGNQVMRWDAASGDEDDVIIVGFRFIGPGYDGHSNGNFGNDLLLAFREGTTDHVGIFLGVSASQGDGDIRAYRGNGTLLGNAGTSSYPQDQWTYMEFKITIHDTTGAVEIRVDGNTVLNLTSIDTNNGGASGVIDNIRFGSAEFSSADHKLCDIVIMNEQGTAFNNFQGPVTIESLRPNGAGNYTNWTPDTGSNHDRVDDPPEAIHDGDTSYVETTAVARDSYAVEDLVSAEDPIAVQAKATAKFTTGTGFDVNTFLRRSSTDNDGPIDTSLTSGYADRAISIWETDPIAAGAWTNANFDATEFGIRAS